MYFKGALPLLAVLCISTLSLSDVEASKRVKTEDMEGGSSLKKTCFDDDEVTKLLQDWQNQKLSQAARDEAAWRLAAMRYENRANKITDEQAAEYFTHAMSSQYLPQFKRDIAAYGLAAMCYENRTKMITDDQAVQYFMRTLKSRHLFQGKKNYAALSLANLCLNKATNMITNDEAIRILAKQILKTSDTQARNEMASLIVKLTKPSAGR